jgi:hypothetical protein
MIWVNYLVSRFGCPDSHPDGTPIRVFLVFLV